MSYKIVPVYATTDDITFIMREEYNGEGYVTAAEVLGFYYGEPNDKLNVIYQGSLKAQFD